MWISLSLQLDMSYSFSQPSSLTSHHRLAGIFTHFKMCY